MNEKSGAQISQKAFVQSLVILLIFMIFAGTLTRVIPAGKFARIEVDGREIVQPDSFAFTDRADYPIWRWFTAPMEVLGGEDSLTIIVIILFLLMVGAAFAVLDKSGILQAALSNVVKKYGDQKYTLLLVISFFFMALGAFFGIFEEVVPLVPIMIALSYSLGWDTLTGLGMSILATNMGFSAAITNPFTIGVAQKLAGLPLFSGAWFRIIIFIVMYAILAIFLTRYAKKIEKDPKASPVYEEDLKSKSQYDNFQLDNLATDNPNLKKAIRWIVIFIVLILTTLFTAPFVEIISFAALPLVGILFLFGGMGAGFLSGTEKKTVWAAAKEGALGIAPAIPLILMASSIKYIIAQGGVIDTMLFKLANVFTQTSPILAALLVYVLALVIEIFIASGSAKAFLIIPILLPLADLVDVTRQVAVTAYCFGDGFSNLAYPTNPVLLIVLGLTVVTYGKWMKWLLKLWIWVFAATVIFLGIGVMIGYGPF
ncbi:MAG: YfcC family protein [Anaerolineae bacterium]|jgi:uncharacterized ion transporter superfamily protein YfcC|nr:YfcC family protein [Anaerolineae bacterium]MBT7070303.1 YfcC family protein [Anaerolineae bacterium]MBT7990486.1 YfcC family protein [Anaerolineae bacterium]